MTYEAKPATSSIGNKYTQAGKLLSLPVWRAFIQESVHSLAEILAHIGFEDEVFPLVTRQGAADAAHRFLRGLKRERGMRGDQLRRLVGTALPRRHVRDHPIDQPDPQGLRGRHTP